MLNRMNSDARIPAKSDPTANECLLGTTSLLQDDVYDSSGKLLGVIEEIILDVRTGCVRYAVLAVGGFLGIGRKRFAVPWRALTPDANSERCVVDKTLMHFISVPVPNDDPWLQRTDLLLSNEKANRPPKHVLVGATRPT